MKWSCVVGGLLWSAVSSSHGADGALTLDVKSQQMEVRRALMGGEPFVTFCNEKQQHAATRMDQFVESVAAELQKIQGGKEVQIVKIGCGEKMASGSTLQKMYGLKREHASMPVIMWSVNGLPPKQLKATSYTSPVKGSESKKGGKGTSKQSAEKGTMVQLDAAKLARNLVKNRVPKVLPLVSNDKLLQECLSIKYQICTVLLKNGGSDRVTSVKMSRFIKALDKHRFARGFVVDTSKTQLSINKFIDPTLKDETILVLKRKDFAFSGHPRFLKHTPNGANGGADQENSQQKQAERAEKLKVRQQVMREPVKTSSGDFDGGSLVSLSYELDKIVAAESAAARLEVFRKHKLVNAKAIDLKTKSKSLALLFRPTETSSEGYFLDWSTGSKFVLAISTFRTSLSAEKLANLQEGVFETITRAKKKAKKGSKLIEGHYVDILPDALDSDSQMGTFLRSALGAPAKPETLIPFSQRPMLSKLVTKTQNPYQKPPSSSSKSTLKKKTSKKVPKEGQLDRERQRREEMEKESMYSGAFAMPVEDNEDEDAESLEVDEELFEASETEEVNFDEEDDETEDEDQEEISLDEDEDEADANDESCDT